MTAPAAREPERQAAPATGIARSVGLPAAITQAANAVPAPADHFDETHPLAVFDFSRRGYRETVGAGIVFAVIIFAIAVGILGVGIAQARAGANTSNLLMAGVAVALFVFMGVAVLQYIFARYDKRIRRVEIFADGIRWHSSDGMQRLAWANVEAVYRVEIILNGFPQSELKLVAGNGREVTFDRTLDRYREMMSFVQNRCAEVMCPRKREEAGVCGAEFGPVQVGPAGVSTDGWLAPWESVERYSISGGWLWFEFRGRGRKGIPLGTIPNYLVLLYLLGEFAPAPVRAASGLPATAGR
jgi:hypothetical protein